MNRRSAAIWKCAAALLALAGVIAHAALLPQHALMRVTAQLSSVQAEALAWSVVNGASFCTSEAAGQRGDGVPGGHAKFASCVLCSTFQTATTHAAPPCMANVVRIAAPAGYVLHQDLVAPVQARRTFNARGPPPAA